MSIAEVIKGFGELGTQPEEANKLLVGLGIIGASALSATGVRASYRNRGQEAQERAKAKEMKDSDPYRRFLDPNSPLRSFVK